MLFGENIERWRMKVLSKADKWRRKIISKHKPQGELDKVDMTGAEIKEIGFTWYGRRLARSYAYGLYKNKKLMAILITTPRISEQGKNKIQMINLNQKLEIIDKNGTYCEGNLAHYFYELHAKYNGETYIMCGDKPKYSLRFFPAGEEPKFNVRGTEYRGVMVIYGNSEPKFFAPNLPAAGRSILDMVGNVVLEFERVGFLGSLKYTVLEGIVKPSIRIRRVAPEFPRGMVMVVGTFALDVLRLYSSPPERLPPREKIFGDW